MRECILLDEKLRQMEQEISVTPQFIQKVCLSLQILDSGTISEMKPCKK